MKTIKSLNSPSEGELKICYLEGTIVGQEFISAGKTFWITDDRDKEDKDHVFLGHLFTDVPESEA